MQMSTIPSGCQTDREEHLLLPVDELSDLMTTQRDQVSDAIGLVAKPQRIGCSAEAMTLHEHALGALGPVRTIAVKAIGSKASKAESDAIAYDQYFSITRVSGDKRQIFALGILIAFRDLFSDMTHGTHLDEVGMCSVRVAELELLRLIVEDKDLY